VSSKLEKNRRVEQMKNKRNKILVMIPLYFILIIGFFCLFSRNMNIAYAVVSNNSVELSSEVYLDTKENMKNAQKTLILINDPNFISGFEQAVKGDYEGALAKFQVVLNDNPNNGDLHFIIGMIYYELDKMDELINAFNNAVKYGGVVLDEFGSEFYSYFAIAYLDKEEYLQAVNLSRKAISLDSKNYYPYYIAGLILNRLGQETVAISNFEKSIELEPDFYRAYNNLGVSYQHLEEFDKAKESYEKAIELVEEADVVYHKAHMNLGNTYSDLGQYEKALLFYKKGAELQPGDANVYYNPGNAYRKLNKHELAIDSYEKAIELDPNHDKAFNNLGIVYYNMGDYEKALELYEKAFEINPKNETAQDNVADIYVKLGEYDKGITMLKDIIEKKPVNVEARYSLAMAYCNLDKADEALEEFYKIIAIDPEHIKTNHSLAILNAELGNREEAILYRDKAIELGVDFDEGHLEMIDNLK